VGDPSGLRRVLARNIRSVIAQKGQSVVTLADLADVSPAHLYDVVRCQKAATIDFVEKIANALGVAAWRLLQAEELDARKKKNRS
jgi:transcriptional regulator with XRE-family HTH domain